MNSTKIITIVTFVILSLALTACQTFKPTAFKTLKVTGDTVDTAMMAYADALITPGSNIGVETQVRIQTLHAQFQSAFRKAVVAAQFDYGAAPPAEVASLAAEIASLIAVYIH